MLFLGSRQDDFVCVYYIMWNDSHLVTVRPLFLAPVRVSAHTVSISQQNKPPKPHRIGPRPRYCFGRTVR